MNDSWTASEVVTADQIAYWATTWSSYRDFSSHWDSGTDEHYPSLPSEREDESFRTRP